MNRKLLVLAFVSTFGFAGSSVLAAPGGPNGTPKVPDVNAAMPAISGGKAETATPAVSGNPTAKVAIKENHTHANAYTKLAMKDDDKKHKPKHMNKGKHKDEGKEKDKDKGKDTKGKGA
jgi:hypothetical protein